VKLISSFDHDHILVMNADLFTNIDFEDFYEFFSSENADMAIATIPYNVDVPYAILASDGHRINSLQEKPRLTYYANAGIYLIKRKYLDLIKPGEFCDATDVIQMLITGGQKVVRYPIVGYWVDIGRPEDYSKVNEFVKHTGHN